ncbi:MAG: extracellular solute-binding protein [Deltaproteobacteria bacterium]|nr:extracellular solute-binding protein [Deltaproteobacteria bacterium]
MVNRTIYIVPTVLFLFLVQSSRHVESASLPKSSQEMVKNLGLEAGALDGVEQELKMPKEVMEGAKKEGMIKIRSTPWTASEQKKLFASFQERYPFIKIDFSGANQQGRTVKTLMAFRGGRVIADVVTSIGGFLSDYEKVGALTDLRDLPNWKYSPEEGKNPNGLWIGIYLRHWCIAYNTRLLKKSDLPKKWEDILENPVWHKGNLALGNRPQLWALMLWKAKGEEWTKNYVSRLFMEVRPQLRKEGMNAMVQLAAAGEFYASVPASKSRTYQMLQRGAPIGFTCPEPVPVTTEAAIILKGAPNPNASKLFLNWMMSREGQLAAYYGRSISPIREDLQRKELIPFADQILGRKVSFRDPDLQREVMPKLNEVWNDLWLRGKRP